MKNQNYRSEQLQNKGIHRLNLKQQLDQIQDDKEHHMQAGFQQWIVINITTPNNWVTKAFTGKTLGDGGSSQRNSDILPGSIIRSRD